MEPSVIPQTGSYDSFNSSSIARRGPRSGSCSTRLSLLNSIVSRDPGEYAGHFGSAGVFVVAPAINSTGKPPRHLQGGHAKDRIVVVVRDPYWLHVFWELTHQSVQRAEAAPGQRFGDHVTITDAGRDVLHGITDWLTLQPPPRWGGGVLIDARHRA